ncbi:Na+/H+ antiporter subunit E [Arcobacter sp. LA11]|uniref:Na+/H+ antiporter subunit E n=1 Tax=Arcobacter sp. LA11 TaxID=1898176 RepID=UPI000933C047|nr:Na+/H+ antiporter subunit E [Arcobacter sp. LA11]
MTTRYYFILAFVLALFWFLLSGHTSILLLTLGLASIILVTWLVSRMDRNDNAPIRMLFSIEFLSYLAWLVWQVLLTNIDVARRIWKTSLPIKPTCRKIKVSVKNPLIKTIYANSITLTPGTVTTEVGEDYFIVHALNVEGLDELEEGEMERRLIRLEEKQ